MAVKAAIEAKLEARRRAETDRFRQYRDSPEAFVEDGLLGFAWSKQREILRSVRDNRFTAVRSCHDAGKTYVAAAAGAWWLSVWDPGDAFLVSTAPTFDQVRGLLWREINRLHRAGGLPGRTNQTEWFIGDELVGFGRKPDDDNPTGMQGTHARRVLVIGDEACGLAKTILDAMDTLVTNEDSRVLLIGNPDDPAAEFANACKPGSAYNVISISAFDTPNFTGETVPEYLRPLLVSKTWVDERRKKWGETSPLWKSKVLGEFPSESADGLIPLASIAAAQARTLEPGQDDPDDLGVDVARFGLDSTVMYHRRGPRARRVDKVQGRDTMKTVGRVVELHRELGFRRVKVDDVGVGGGVSDRLAELAADRTSTLFGVEVVRINVAEAPARDGEAERFKNKRGELNWAMRERFVVGDIDIDKDDADLAGQAADMRYANNSRGQVEIEKKDDMKKRTGGRSPDDWDALVLAFSEPAYAGAGILAFTKSEAAKVAEGKKPKADLPGIAMMAPPGVGSVYGIDGERYTVTDGRVVVKAADVAPLRGAGFTEVATL